MCANMNRIAAEAQRVWLGQRGQQCKRIVASCRAWWRAAIDTDGGRSATTTVADRSADHITASGSGWRTNCWYGAECGRRRSCGSSIVFHCAGLEVLSQSEPRRSLHPPGFRDHLRLPATDRGPRLLKVSLHTDVSHSVYLLTHASAVVAIMVFLNASASLRQRCYGLVAIATIHLFTRTPIPATKKSRRYWQYNFF